AEPFKIRIEQQQCLALASESSQHFLLCCQRRRIESDRYLTAFGRGKFLSLHPPPVRMVKGKFQDLDRRPILPLQQTMRRMRYKGCCVVIGMPAFIGMSKNHRYSVLLQQGCKPPGK